MTQSLLATGSRSAGLTSQMSVTSLSSSQTGQPPGIFCHAYELQAKVANSVEGAVEVGLIADLADEDALLVARFEGKPLECGREASGQAPPDRDPVTGRLHAPPGAL